MERLHNTACRSCCNSLFSQRIGGHQNPGFKFFLKDVQYLKTDPNLFILKKIRNEHFAASNPIQIVHKLKNLTKRKNVKTEHIFFNTLLC